VKTGSFGFTSVYVMSVDFLTGCLRRVQRDGCLRPCIEIQEAQVVQCQTLFQGLSNESSSFENTYICCKQSAIKSIQSVLSLLNA